MDLDIADDTGRDDAREQFWARVPMSADLAADRVEIGLGRKMTRAERHYYVMGYNTRLDSLRDQWGERATSTIEYRAVVSCG